MSDGEEDFARPEPDAEHDVEQNEVIDATATPLAPGRVGAKGKINLKLITIEPFSGEVSEGFLDAGASNYFQRLKVQIQLAEMLDGRKWPEPVKCAVLASRLTKAAGTWHVRNQACLPTTSFRDFGKAFKRHFRAKLPTQRIGIILAETRKFPHETYYEFAHRLSQIASGLNEGEISNYTEQQALTTFINHAYPKYTSDLIGKVNLEADDATAEIEATIDLLTRLAGSDGRASLPKRRAEDVVPFRRSDKKPRMGGANVASTSKGPRQRWDFSDAICKTCNERGHTTNYHDRHVAQLRQAKSGTNSADREQ